MPGVATLSCEHGSYIVDFSRIAGTIGRGRTPSSGGFMHDNETIDPVVYEWRPGLILLPRIALKVTRTGTRNSLLLPGRYLIRRSRSLGRLVYRRVHY